jgi:hypothetical protein
MSLFGGGRGMTLAFFFSVSGRLEFKGEECLRREIAELIARVLDQGVKICTEDDSRRV